MKVNLLENTHLKSALDSISQMIDHDVKVITCDLIGHTPVPRRIYLSVYATEEIAAEVCSRCGAVVSYEILN